MNCKQSLNLFGGKKKKSGTQTFVAAMSLLSDQRGKQIDTELISLNGAKFHYDIQSTVFGPIRIQHFLWMHSTIFGKISTIKMRKFGA